MSVPDEYVVLLWSDRWRCWAPSGAPRPYAQAVEARRDLQRLLPERVVTVTTRDGWRRLREKERDRGPLTKKERREYSRLVPRCRDTSR